MTAVIQTAEAIEDSYLSDHYESQSDFLSTLLAGDTVDVYESARLSHSIKPETLIFTDDGNSGFNLEDFHTIDHQKARINTAIKDYVKTLGNIFLSSNTLRRFISHGLRSLDNEKISLLPAYVKKTTDKLANTHQEAVDRLNKILDEEEVFSDYFDNFVHAVKNQIMGDNIALTTIEGEVSDIRESDIEFLQHFFKNSWTLELLKKKDDFVKSVINGTTSEFKRPISKIFDKLYKEATRNYPREVKEKIRYEILYEKKDEMPDSWKDDLLAIPDSIWLAVDQFTRNAVDSIAETGREGTVTLKIKNKKNHWNISVIDNGTGMNRETIQNVIIDGMSTKDKVHGGKGLTNALNVICDRLGGMCLITSQEGLGTLMKAKIPKNKKETS